GTGGVRLVVLLGLAWAGVLLVFLFFSSRRRHTRLVSDWSSDVCSSDLACAARATRPASTTTWCRPIAASIPRCSICWSRAARSRSEERRVGKECRSRWEQYH